MKIKLIYAVLLTIIGLLFITGCSNMGSFENQDIQTVKKSVVDTGNGQTTIEQAISQLAGINGKASWTAFHPDGASDFVRCVEASVTRKVGDTDHTVQIQYLLNRNTGLVQTGATAIDGKDVSAIEYMTRIMQWAIIDMKN
jgi:hypothetical protein